MASISLNKKQIRWILIAAAVVIVALLLFFGFRRRSGYQFPTASPGDSNDQTLNASITACELTFDGANTWVYYNSGYTGTNLSNAVTSITSNLNQCVYSNVSTYMINKCPFSDTSSATLARPSGANYSTSANTAYNQYLTDIATIQTAYNTLAATPGSTTTAAVLTAARKADYTGAIRKYIATVCSCYYDSGTQTGINTQYAGWSTSPAAGAFGFDSTRITDANLTAWAAGAATDQYGTAGLLTGNKYSSSASASQVTGQTATPSGATASIPYYAIARDFGPGTVGTNIWTTFTDRTTGGAGTFNNATTKGQIATLPFTFS